MLPTAKAHDPMRFQRVSSSLSMRRALLQCSYTPAMDIAALRKSYERDELDEAVRCRQQDSPLA